MPARISRFLRDLWTLARPYWFSEEKISARLLLAPQLDVDVAQSGELLRERRVVDVHVQFAHAPFQRYDHLGAFDGQRSLLAQRLDEAQVFDAVAVTGALIAHGHPARESFLAMQRSQHRRPQNGQPGMFLDKLLRQRFHRAFWSPLIDSYALALDGKGDACAVRTSNAGHCLWTGIATPAAAASIARQLLSPTSFNGWGVRTLDEREARYNPMSYHNGSVWPHDNALIGMGLARYGYRSEVLRIFSGLFDTASALSLFRLPELFCGFPRREEEGPTFYPVACSPQAWASGSVFGLLEAATGMTIEREPGSGRVQVSLNNPVLPKGLDLLEISGLRLGEEEIDLQVHRSDHDVGVLVRNRTPGVDVLIRK